MGLIGFTLQSKKSLVYFSVNVHLVFLVIEDILTGKIERNVYVNEEKSVSDVRILIIKKILLFSLHKLLMRFIS